MLIDKPTRTLVPARCNPIFHGKYVMGEDKNYPQVKIWTKSARNLEYYTEYTLHI